MLTFCGWIRNREMVTNAKIKQKIEIPFKKCYQNGSLDVSDTKYFFFFFNCWLNAALFQISKELEMYKSYLEIEAKEEKEIECE